MVSFVIFLYPNSGAVRVALMIIDNFLSVTLPVTGSIKREKDWHRVKRIDYMGEEHS